MFKLLGYLFTKEAGGVRLVRALIGGMAVITALGRLPATAVEWIAVVTVVLTGLITKNGNNKGEN